MHKPDHQYHFSGRCVLNIIADGILEIDDASFNTLEEDIDRPITVNDIQDELFDSIDRKCSKAETYDCYFEGQYTWKRKHDSVGKCIEIEKKAWITYVVIDPYEWCENG